MTPTAEDLCALADASRGPLRLHFTGTRKALGWVASEPPATLMHEMHDIRRLCTGGLLTQRGSDYVLITPAGKRALRRAERDRQQTLLAAPPAASAQVESVPARTRHSAVRGILALVIARLTRRRA